MKTGTSSAKSTSMETSASTETTTDQVAMHKDTESTTTPMTGAQTEPAAMSPTKFTGADEDEEESAEAKTRDLLTKDGAGVCGQPEEVTGMNGETKNGQSCCGHSLCAFGHQDGEGHGKCCVLPVRAGIKALTGATRRG